MEDEVINIGDVKRLMRSVMLVCSKEKMENEVRNWFEEIEDEG